MRSIVEMSEERASETGRCTASASGCRRRQRAVQVAEVDVRFGVTIGVNATFITLAMRTHPGEDVPRSYYQGLNFNDTLAQRRERRRGLRRVTAFDGCATRDVTHRFPRVPSLFGGASRSFICAALPPGGVRAG